MKLKPCPSPPNCVCSAPGHTERHAVAPLSYKGDVESAKAKLRKAIESLGNVRWVREEKDYWRVECRTRWLRFVDDLELDFATAPGTIHVRSASRVGRYDFGANRKRIELLRDKMTPVENK